MVTSARSTLKQQLVQQRLNMPQYDRTLVLEPDHPTMSEARDNMSGPEARFYDHCVKIYNDGKLTPFRHARTARQRQLTYIITSTDGWDRIEGKISTEVERHNFLGVDTEKYQPMGNITANSTNVPWRFRPRATFFLIGTFEGTAVIIDLDQLHVGRRACVADPIRSLPPVILSWIRRTDIAVMGSGIRRDLEELGIEGNSLIDSRRVFMDAMQEDNGLAPIVQIGSKARVGLGIQMYYSRSFDYKPMLPSQFTKYYGPARYFKANGEDDWPKFRIATTLYRWVRTDNNRLFESSIYYLYNDAASAASLVARLGMDMMARSRLNITEACTTPQIISRITQGARENTVPAFVYLGHDSVTSESSDSDGDIPVSALSKPGPSGDQKQESTREVQPDESSVDKDDDIVDHFGKELVKQGYNYYGNENMYSGIFGNEMKVDIYMGLVYYQRLRHMVSDKSQARALGPIDVLTHQPVKGRKKQGGIRFGEMERDSLLAHGASFCLNDRLMKCSDYSVGYVCDKCGSIISTYMNKEIRKNEHVISEGGQQGKHYNINQAPYCRVCDSYECKKVALPYVLRYMTNELSAMNIKMKFNLDTEMVHEGVKAS